MQEDYVQFICRLISHEIKTIHPIFKSDILQHQNRHNCHNLCLHREFSLFDVTCSQSFVPQGFRRQDVSAARTSMSTYKVILSFISQACFSHLIKQ